MKRKRERKNRNSDSFERLFPHAGARRAADEAAEAAWRKDPEIKLVTVCAIWNDAYARLAPHPGAGA